MSVRRFWNVWARRGSIVHRMYAQTKVEGNLTACGIKVRKGWRWAVPGAKVTRCKRCNSRRDF